MRAPQKTRLTTVRTPTPESALLLACARPNVDVVPLPRVRSCARAVRCWPQFLALVERHRMLPLVYVHLRSLAQGSMPRAILEELLTDVMFDLPTREDVVEVKVTESCITNGTQPLLEISPIRRKKEA